MTHQRRTPTAFLLTAALHLALLLALLSPQHRPAPPQRDGAAIQWLLPAPALTARQQPRQASAAPAVRAQRPVLPQQTAARETKPDPDQPAAPAPEAAAAPAATTATAQAARQADDLFAANAPPASAGVAQLMLKSGYGAGAVDRDLRGGKAAPLAADGGALQAKIEEAFSKAVARKWHDPATIQEISTPSDRVRVYKMTTGSGTVCISIPDPSMEKTYKYTITNCPREDRRGTVSPAVAKPQRTQP
jgi:hypothetical protein